jgi:hypothetical protein
MQDTNVHTIDSRRFIFTQVAEAIQRRFVSTSVTSVHASKLFSGKIQCKYLQLRSKFTVADQVQHFKLRNQFLLYRSIQTTIAI